MGKPQFIRTEGGEEIVILSRRDYDVLLAEAGDEAAEDRLSANLVARSDAAIAEGTDVILPEAIWSEIEAGNSPIRVLRKYLGLTQAELAERAGVTQGYIADLETSRKTGSPETLKAIAKALSVPLDVLVG
jgi:DNA-binding XRE family transcriptional regulator